MMLKCYSTRSFALSAVAAGALFALWPQGVQAQDLTIVMESRLGVLDPMITGAHQTRDHGYLIYDTLLALDENQEIKPQMVDAWEVSEDGTTYIFTLRDGLLFHDGVPVTAADAVASIQRWAQRDRMGGVVMANVAEITANDDKTFTVVQSQPSNLILTALAKPSGMPLFVLPAEVAATPVSEAITNYTGSGPFVFDAEQFEPGARAVYTKFEEYVPRNEPPSWFAGGKVAKVEAIERIEMRDSMTALNALMNGEVDYLQSVPLDLIPMLPQDGSVVVHQQDTLGYQIGYRLNHLNLPFNDKAVRNAAMLAIGQEDGLLAQFGSAEYFAICGAAFGCGMPYESDQMVDLVIDSDVAAAKAALAATGYDGETVRILRASDVHTSEIPLVMAQNLREAGFTVTVDSMDFMTMLSRRANMGPVADGGWSIFVTSWHNIEISDPIRSFMVSAEGENGYAGWATEPRIAEMTMAFQFAATEEERKTITEEMQKIIFEEGIFGPQGNFARRSGWRSNVSGAIDAPANLFWNISVDE